MLVHYKEQPQIPVRSLRSMGESGRIREQGFGWHFNVIHCTTPFFDNIGSLDHQPRLSSNDSFPHEACLELGGKGKTFDLIMDRRYSILPYADEQSLQIHSSRMPLVS